MSILRSPIFEVASCSQAACAGMAADSAANSNHGLTRLGMRLCVMAFDRSVTEASMIAQAKQRARRRAGLARLLPPVTASESLLTRQLRGATRSRRLVVRQVRGRPVAVGDRHAVLAVDVRVPRAPARRDARHPDAESISRADFEVGE